MKWILTYLYLAVFYLLGSSQLFGQEYIWKNISFEGVQQTVDFFDIEEDNQGFIWCSTDLGMVRYDGVNIKIFDQDDNWPIGTKTFDVEFDSKNNMWINPKDSVLMCIRNYNSKKIEVLPFHKIKGNSPICVYGDTVFVSNNGKLFIIINQKIVNEIAIPVDTLKEIRARSVSFNPENSSVYIAMYQGVFVYNMVKKQFTMLSQSDGLLETEVNELEYQPGHGVWAGHVFGVSLIRRDHQIKIVDRWTEEREVQCIAYKDEIVLCATFSGLCEYVNEKPTQVFYKDYYNNDPGRFFSTLISNDNTIWGGSTVGLDIIPNRNIIRYSINNNKQYDEYGLSGNQHTIYVGSVSRRFNILEMKDDSIISNVPIQTLHYGFNTFYDQYSKSIYITGFEGMSRLDGKKLTNLSSHVNGEFYIYAVWDDMADSAIYVGTGFGILKIKNNTFKPIYAYRNGVANKPFSVFYGKVFQGRHIVATVNGLYQVINDTLKPISVLKKNNIGNTDIYFFTTDSYGNVYADIGNNQILIYKDNNYKVYNLYKHAGLKGPYKIVISGDKLWLLTTNKIVFCHIRNILNNDIEIISILYEEDGLVSTFPSACPSYIDSSGNFWNSRTDGLIKIKYPNMKKNLQENKNHLLSFKVFGEEYDYKKHKGELLDVNSLPINPVLNYNENELSFEFVGICHKNQQRVEYRVKLEGLDKEWRKSVKENKITFSNLDPGKYRFMFYSCNNNGVWNKEPYIFPFVILPPWWATWWFYTLLGLMGIIMVLLLLKWRISIQKKKLKKQELFTQDIINAQEDERKRIAGDLHDGVGQELSMLMLHAKKEDYVDMSDRINKVIGELRLISKNLRPVEFESDNFINIVQNMINEISQYTNIEIFFGYEDGFQINSKSKELLLYRIIQEGLHNIIKHSKATNAAIKLDMNTTEVTAIIEDNGVGLDNLRPEQLRSINERVRMLHGSLKLYSPPSKGLKIVIKFPR